MLADITVNTYLTTSLKTLDYQISTPNTLPSYRKSLTVNNVG